MKKYYALNLAVWLDLFLFITGQPSVIGYLLGGMYFAHFFIAPFLSVMGFIKGKEYSRKHFIVFTAFLVVLITCLGMLIGPATKLSKSRVRDLAARVVFEKKSEFFLSGDVSKDEFYKISVIKLQMDHYYPLERRGDFYLNTEEGGKYSLVIKERWESPRIFINKIK